MMLVCYESHNKAIIKFSEKNIYQFNKLRRVFLEKRLLIKGKEMGHFNIPKLYLLTHYTWIIQIGTLDNFYTLQSEAIYKSMKEAY
jgi:hypothetical protein